MSINGQREYANGFTVNDSDVVERFTMGAAIIPNLDSIAEFRVLTGNFDAQYGNYAGGRINVITKSGSNQFHGAAFEFLRNTDFDARNFFSPERGTFQQNQVGGLFGGPIVKNKVFFYADYQATLLTEGVDTGLIQVPSLANRSGNFSDTGQSTNRNGKWAVLGQSVEQQAGLFGGCGRALLYTGLRKFVPMRLSRRYHSTTSMVRARAEIAPIYTDRQPAE